MPAYSSLPGWKYHYAINILQLINLMYLLVMVGKRLDVDDKGHTLNVMNPFEQFMCWSALCSCLLQIFEEARGAYGLWSEFIYQGTIWTASKHMGQEMRARDIILKCMCWVTSIIIQADQLLQSHKGERMSIEVQAVLPAFLSIAVL